MPPLRNAAFWTVVGLASHALLAWAFRPDPILPQEDTVDTDKNNRDLDVDTREPTFLDDDDADEFYGGRFSSCSCDTCVRSRSQPTSAVAGPILPPITRTSQPVPASYPASPPRPDATPPRPRVVDGPGSPIILPRQRGETDKLSDFLPKSRPFRREQGPAPKTEPEERSTSETPVPYWLDTERPTFSDDDDADEFYGGRFSSCSCDTCVRSRSQPTSAVAGPIPPPITRTRQPVPASYPASPPRPGATPPRPQRKVDARGLSTVLPYVDDVEKFTRLRREQGLAPKTEFEERGRGSASETLVPDLFDTKTVSTPPFSPLPPARQTSNEEGVLSEAKVLRESARNEHQLFLQAEASAKEHKRAKDAFETDAKEILRHDSDMTAIHSAQEVQKQAEKECILSSQAKAAAKKHRRARDAFDRDASEMIFKENNKNKRPFDDDLDFHRLFVREAIVKAKEAILQREKRGDREVRFIVGKGSRAALRLGLAKRIQNMPRAVITDPDNEGRLIVTLNNLNPSSGEIPARSRKISSGKVRGGRANRENQGRSVKAINFLGTLDFSE
ncbi:hypothetical protein DFH07DRAFT_573546 [Mycena maculata]|uniref:Smr domain-containing protein n=1 Tax=Mycena maculata TaxID=230809 RepID=A0AAD7IPR9_9AGAR|nr:hypothetical protein DFH07DRAFT_573546 [Mycena maculata]